MPRLLVSVLLIIAASFAHAAAPPPSLLPAHVEQAITARVADGQYPAMVVAVVDGERSHIYGFGKLANDKAPAGDTLFQIGSITKTFTASLLSEAVNKGEVKLDAPVSGLLPGFKIPSRNGKLITLRDLAMQDSGLPRVPSDFRPANMQDPYAGFDAANLKDFLAHYTLSRDPGASYEYSNVGVGLLGYALALHAGTSYSGLLQTRIFKPLNMTFSSATFKEPLSAHWATGHDQAGNPTPPWHPDVLSGAFAINSTGADMLRYLEANLGHGPAELVNAMRASHTARRDIGNDERIGLVWMTHHDKDGDVVWHDGETGGYASFIGFTADGHRGVVILTNIQRSVDDLGFATLLADAPLTPAEQQIAMLPRQLDAYVGAYQLAPKFVLRVFRDKDQLFAQATGQEAFPIYPSAEDAFFARVAGIRLYFQRGKGGKVNSLALHQNGHTTLALKEPLPAT